MWLFAFENLNQSVLDHVHKSILRVCLPVPRHILNSPFELLSLEDIEFYLIRCNSVLSFLCHGISDIPGRSRRRQQTFVRSQFRATYGAVPGRGVGDLVVGLPCRASPLFSGAFYDKVSYSKPSIFPSDTVRLSEMTRSRDGYGLIDCTRLDSYLG
jgi:hypothetical protein